MSVHSQSEALLYTGGSLFCLSLIQNIVNILCQCAIMKILTTEATLCFSLSASQVSILPQHKQTGNVKSMVIL